MSDLHAVPETPEVQALHRRLADICRGVAIGQSREKNHRLGAPRLAVVGDLFLPDGVRRSDQARRHR